MPASIWVISSEVSITAPIRVEQFTQSAAGVLTVYVSDPNTALIVANSIVLDGALIVDLSGITVYDGLEILLASGSTTGQWSSVVLSLSTTECVQYTLSVTYGTLTTGAVRATQLCASPHIFSTFVAVFM